MKATLHAAGITPADVSAPPPLSARLKRGDRRRKRVSVMLGLDKAQHQLKMLMRTVSGIDEDEDEPGGIEESASMRRAATRVATRSLSGARSGACARWAALWWMLAAQGIYLLLFLLADYVFDELGSRYACNVATLVVTLLSLITVRRAFRHNYSVTVLKRLWSKLPILLALLSTLAVVASRRISSPSRAAASLGSEPRRLSRTAACGGRPSKRWR